MEKIATDKLETLKSVKFTNIFEHNLSVATSFSPCGHAFAAAFKVDLKVWDTDTKELLKCFVCEHPIDSFEWSPDSELIYCSILQGSIIQVWSLICYDWRYKITQRPLAIVHLLWSPDSSHLITFSEFYTQTKVWSLQSGNVTEVEDVKPIKDCISFSSCNKYMGVLMRRKSCDSIAIYTCYTWEVLKVFSTDLKDSKGIYFSPSELVFVLVESVNLDLKVTCYCVDGRKLGSFKKASYLGITTFSWNPKGKSFALGCFSGEVSIVHRRTFEEVTVFSSPESIESKHAVIYKILPTCEQKLEALNPNACDWEFVRVLKERPMSLSSPVTEAKSPKGIHILQHNFDGKYIAAINSDMPEVVYVIDSEKMMQSYFIIHHQRIKSLSWHPMKNILVICAGNNFVHLWSPASCITVSPPFPEPLSISQARWCFSRDCLILDGKKMSCLLYLPEVKMSSIVS